MRPAGVVDWGGEFSQIHGARRPPSKMGPKIDGKWLESYSYMFLGFHFLRDWSLGLVDCPVDGLHVFRISFWADSFLTF